MVSNTIGLQMEELLVLLAVMRSELSGDPDYTELRASLPEGWPM